MDLPHALNHRLCHSCCHCPIAHHISHSQTSLAGERNEDSARMKAGAMKGRVCAGGRQELRLRAFCFLCRGTVFRDVATRSARQTTHIPAVLTLLG